jgi:hypothetical protein
VKLSEIPPVDELVDDDDDEDDDDDDDDDDDENDYGGETIVASPRSAEAIAFGLASQI